MATEDTLVLLAHRETGIVAVCACNAGYAGLGLGVANRCCGQRALGVGGAARTGTRELIAKISFVAVGIKEALGAATLDQIAYRCLRVCTMRVLQARDALLVCGAVGGCRICAVLICKAIPLALRRDTPALADPGRLVAGSSRCAVGVKEALSTTPLEQIAYRCLRVCAVRVL